MPAASLTPKQSQSPLGRSLALLWTLLLVTPPQPGLLTSLCSNVSGYKSPGLQPLGFPNRPRSKVATTGVLPLRAALIYSEAEAYKGLKKVLNQEEPKF